MFKKYRMKKQLLLCTLSMFITLSLTACSGTTAEISSAEGTSDNSADTVTVTTTVDGEDYTMEFTEAPSRAVSLSGFTTEMMLALGLEQQMVGTAYEDNEILPQYKDAYESIPKLSDQFPSQEVLLEASPDFVTGWKSITSEKNYPPEFLNQNNIKFFIPHSEYIGTMAAVYEDFTILGQIFHVEDTAATLVADMKEQLGVINDKVKDNEAVSVFLYDSGEDAPYTAGAALPSELIQLAGGENIFAAEDDYWLTVQWEAVVAKNPQWIVVMQYNMDDDVQAKIDFLKNTPALQEIDAVKNDQIIVLGLSDVTAGVRNVNAVETMAKSFHKDAFE